MEESMVRYISVTGVYYKLEKRITEGGMMEPGGSWMQRKSFSFPCAFKT
jgi:hypothetical protein